MSMASSQKRKQCDGCGDTFSSNYNTKRHRLTCPAQTPDSEHDMSEDSDDEEEEIYVHEDDIEDLLKSFQPSAPSVSDSCHEVRPFMRALVFWTCLFLCLWQSVFYISSNAISILLQYIHGVLTVAAEHYKLLSAILPLFPSSVYLLHRLLKIDRNSFIHYVVCPSCHSIYTYSDCVTVMEGEEVSKTCPYVSQPNHPMQHYRRPCGAQLLQSVRLPSGKKKLLPFKNYYYKPLKESLADLLVRHGFEDKCNHWRRRQVSDSTLSDIYDGQIWKTFTENFLAEDRNYGLMLNLDWFQPYKHVKYSVGVMYMVILNLPRHERFRRENIIIVSIIPHMKKEPPTNTFVQPLVDDLLHAWNTGFSLRFGQHQKLFHLALMCIGCDIPACRKLCGFLGHSAVQGCSRCNKTFPGSFGSRDYSGFNRDEWQPRTHAEHTRQIREITRCTTKQAREKLESKYGTRYSVLSELPYIDLIRMSIIDPMHNLFLGTAKHMLHIWKDTGVLSDKDFDSVQAKVDAVDCPSDIGRIPYKISSGFSGFNADQYKNWTLLFSVFALKGIIADEHLECWRSFVLACRMLCCRSITYNSIKVADVLFIRFCRSFERLYGKERVTPNMHLHGHLSECVLDFGPIYSFWLFAFERCNGILGDIPTNKKNIELQLMRRFLCHTHLLGMTLNDEFNFASTLQPILEELSTGTKVGTLATMTTSGDYELRQMSSRLNDPATLTWTNIGHYTYSKFKIQGLNNTEESYLSTMYKTLYSTNVDVMPACREIKTVYLGTQLLGSARGRSRNSSYITAYWTNNRGQISWSVNPRPGQILRFLQHTVLVDNVEKTHLLAEVSWFMDLPDSVKNHCGRPVEAWHPYGTLDRGPASFMPVQRIKSKLLRMFGTVGNRQVLFVCPRDRFVSV